MRNGIKPEKGRKGGSIGEKRWEEEIKGGK
jgi:hypothetical protein